MVLIGILLSLMLSLSESLDHGSPIVAFTALMSDETIGASAVVKYNRVVTNLGGAYRPTTGIFTAPYHGLYSFSCSLMSHPLNEVHLDLVKNGRRISRVFSASYSFPQSSETLYLVLNRGDRIWMQNAVNRNSRVYDGRKYNVFSGTLLKTL